jgi:hypothetical protein
MTEVTVIEILVYPGRATKKKMGIIKEPAVKEKIEQRQVSSKARDGSDGIWPTAASAAPQTAMGSPCEVLEKQKGRGKSLPPRRATAFEGSGVCSGQNAG